MVFRSVYTPGLLALLCLLLVACEPVGQSLEEAVTEETRIPTQESWNPVIRINSVGKENVQARAAYSAHFDNPREILFVGRVQLDFFDLEGNHTSLMTADTGRVDERRHLFTANGNVHVVADSGMTLSTQVLHWNEDKETIYTAEPIVLTTETDTLYGVGFESDANLENWTIKQPTGVSYREFDDE